MIIYFRFSCFLFKIQILLIKISKQQVISYFLDQYWLRYGPSKMVEYKNGEIVLFKNYMVFEFLFDFFFKKSTYRCKISRRMQF
jgi:hypothetical protein